MLVSTMGALDLLFATKPDSERLHQAALMVLCERTPLLSYLTGIQLQSPKLTWEPEQGAFDLLAEDAAGQRLLIELKVDSILSRRQITAQIGHAAVVGGAVPVYILVGTSAITRGPRWGQWRWVVGDRPRPRIFDTAALRAAIQASIGDDAEDEVRELTRSYERVLDGLSARHQGYRSKTVDAFLDHDYLGYFDELRQAVDLGVGATVEYVPNAAGGFVCCAWEGIPTRQGGLYLQFEYDSLCLKVWVDDMEKSERPQARRKAVEAAITTAATYPGLAVEAAKGKAGETMTLARLPGIRLTSNPRDEGLLAALREAQAFVKAIAANLA